MTIREVKIPFDDKALLADLCIPSNSIGLVIFSHGTGSGRHSVRNQFVAKELNKANIATLLLDLLTTKEDKEESAGAMKRFDIDFLSARLQAGVKWCRQDVVLKNLPIGIFGASTGAASALQVAASMPESIVTVVSRGGRPDLAKRVLPQVLCPVLLIVGAEDHIVIELNRRAYEALHGEKQLEIVPRATHLFEEPGTLEIVAQLATSWFSKQFMRTF